MTGPKDGGPAFAAVAVSAAGDISGSEGMTLRDWFAGQAMASIVVIDGIQYAANVTAHAKWSYEQADAMLIAREEKP